jgi:glycosyltransferase involved in cell wall biosynthesis
MNQISLVMIVKNEESTLEHCLVSIAPYVDEIIIVDTGSTDRTKEIAFKYTNMVYDYVWVNDFAAARNYSISKASNEYILVLDSDEIVEDIDIDIIKLLIEQNKKKIGRIMRINEYTRKDAFYKYNERINRIFSKKYYQYEGIIHEQVVPISAIPFTEQSQKDEEVSQSHKTLTDPDNTYLVPLTIRHSGYEGNLETRKKKTDRNISLLKLALESTPNDPYILYQLGKSYYMEENYVYACEFFSYALYADLDPRLEYVQDLVESYGYSLINSGQYETALQLLNIYDEFSGSADFIFLIALIFMNNGRFQEAVREFLKATEKSCCKMEGVNSYLSYYNIAVIYECLGQNDKARRNYLKCEDYTPAKERLNVIR